MELHITPEDVTHIQTLSLLLNASSNRPSLHALHKNSMKHNMHMGIHSNITGPTDMYHLDALEVMLPIVLVDVGEHDNIRKHVELLDGYLRARRGKHALTFQQLVAAVGKIRKKAMAAAGAIAIDVYTKMGWEAVSIRECTEWMLLLREMDCEKGQRQPVHMDCNWPRLVLNIQCTPMCRRNILDQTSTTPCLCN